MDAARGPAVYAFDEDPITAAWDAVRHLPPGTGIRTTMDLPEWWWAGTGLTEGDDHGLALEGGIVHFDGQPIRTSAVLDGDAARIATARDDTLREADVPMGACVTQHRHDQVLVERMQAGEGTVVSWTRIGAGAAPAEFQRLQEAVGAYHVVMVDHGDHRTVGIWSGDAPPAVGQRVRPVLRRLLRQQGVWRHGIKYLPAN